MSIAPAPDDDTRPIDAPRPPVGQPASEALAASSPDQNTILMRMIGLLTAEPSRPVMGLRLMNALFAGIVIVLFVIAQWGVPALLAGQTLILQLNQHKTEQLVADRAVAQQQVTATRDVLDAIAGVGSKVDAQAQATDALGAKIDDQGRRLDALAGDVAELQRGQAATTRGLASVRQRQLQMEAGARTPAKR